MNIKYLLFATVLTLLSVGCSDKKEEPQNQQQVDVPVASVSVKKMPQAKNPKIPLDSSQILTYKDIDQSDSIMVGIRAFRGAEKEFVKRWHYTKDTKLFMDVVGKICRKSRTCASRLDSIAYKKDVAFILDSLMRNNLLDGAIEARIQEMNGPCFGDNYKKNEKKCQEEISNKVYERVMKKMNGSK